MELEILKYGIAGLSIYCMMKIVQSVLEFAAKRMAPPKNGNGNGTRTAGEMAPEYYDKRFDKIDTALNGIVEILRQLTVISGDVHTMLIRSEARGNRGED